MTLVGKDRREILVVSVYNVSQKVDAGIGQNTLYKQQQSAYTLEYHNLKRKNKHKNINPKNLPIHNTDFIPVSLNLLLNIWSENVTFIDRRL